MSQKIALVTGGATGMGRACAIALASKGFTIALNYRSRESEASDVLESLSGPDHRLFQSDISDPQSTVELVENVMDSFKSIEVLVNAAGVFKEQNLADMSYDEWNESWAYNLGANLIGPVNLMYCVSKQMKKCDSGKIINITSRGAFRGEPDAPAYGASKSGLNSASQSFAKSLAPFGISVFAVAPGWVDTPLASTYLNSPNSELIKSQSPLNRVGKPSEIGDLVGYLASGDTEYLTGAIIDANGASYLRN